MTSNTHARDLLSDADWAVLRSLFPKHTRRVNGRLFLEAVLFRARTGTPWRDLPERFGPWTSVFNRFSRWSQRGFFMTMAAELKAQTGLDLSEASLDSTTVKLHASAPL